MAPKVKLIGGYLHGCEIEPKHGGPNIDLLDSESGIVRRYARSSFAFFVKEWKNQEEYEAEGGQTEE